MPLPKSLTTVTTFSKTLAIILFILFPFIGFYAGMQYQKEITQTQTLTVKQVMITPNPSPKSTLNPTPPPGCYYDESRACPAKGCNLVCPRPTNTNTYCTQDAKQCPDGSYVSRTGPNCKFADCPAH